MYKQEDLDLIYDRGYRQGYSDAEKEYSKKNIPIIAEWNSNDCCTSCGFEITSEQKKSGNYKYCPWCGANMEGKKR